MSRVVARVPQAGGGTRVVRAQDDRHGARARRIVADNPAMLDRLDGIDGIAITWVDEPAPKRGRGRPVVADSRRKVVGARFTDAAHAALKSAADAVDLTPSKWLERVALEALEVDGE